MFFIAYSSITSLTLIVCSELSLCGQLITVTSHSSSQHSVSDYLIRLWPVFIVTLPVKMTRLWFCRVLLIRTAAAWRARRKPVTLALA